MQITRVRLHDYRNYQSLALNAAPGLCVLLGENAAGKTNILESMFLCALGRSHRTRHDLELIRYEQPGAFVGISLEKRTGKHTISCKLRRNQPREIRIDDMPLTRSGELLGCLHVVMFSPEDLRLIKQGPAERRRFLDMELSQISRSYYYDLQQYNIALKQRNALLKDVTATAAMYTPWEEQLAMLGARILEKRIAFMQKLSVTARNLHMDLSDGRETLNVVFVPGVSLQDGLEGSQTMIQEQLLRALEETRRKDQLRGNTSVGPHRDDMLLELDGVDVRAYGSQGQQRTAALSLKLSELTLLREIEEEPPVLLLDDVLSELDTARQRCLIKAMCGCQTFLTCTQLAGLEEAGAEHMSVYRVENGAVTLY